MNASRSSSVLSCAEFGWNRMCLLISDGNECYD
jgi:hypothetical protein